jgi:broad specificity phosphatase PhoE
MTTVRRLILVRHGETNGESSLRYHGSADVELSPLGIEQMHEVRRSLRMDDVDLVVGSSLKRSWKAAWLMAGGLPVRLENDFREIDFGRWEGLTREEIAASDPVSFADWQAGAETFEYPGGEPRAAFRARVLGGLGKVLGSPGRGALVVAHKGVIRTIVEGLTGETLDREQPALGEVIQLISLPDGRWVIGRRSSNPAGVALPGATA